jgi:hypothetical protein
MRNRKHSRAERRKLASFDRTLRQIRELPQTGSRNPADKLRREFDQTLFDIRGLPEVPRG